MMVQCHDDDAIGRRERNSVIHLFEHRWAKIPMRRKVRSIVRACRIDTDDKNPVVNFRADALPVHPMLPDIIARAIVISRNEGHSPTPQKRLENVPKKGEFRPHSAMCDVSSDDDVFHVVGDELADERIGSSGRATEMQVGQMSQTSMIHGPPA